jgi:hypothetical protein
MRNVAISIAEFLNQVNNIFQLEGLYDYKFNENHLPENLEIDNSIVTSYHRNVELKNQLHQSWLNGTELSRGDLIEYYIKVWGGIRGNGNNIMNFYRYAPTQDLLSKGFTGVSSYSKALVVHDPNRFYIYDSRVAASINCIQVKQQILNKIYFQIPYSQNVNVRRVRTLLINKSMNENWLNINDDSVYRDYLRLLDITAEYSNFSKDLIEMTLFSLLPILSNDLIFNTDN